ncbi:MAG: hypothetical protein M0D57_07835 [Sphingobacteriales bacterium JAD_PAG50586_3]|nr:MAG: hypothetical protein M0D57_07835 [Sphingobacteriales bacterium JAD_PAG50586_3]
MKKAKFLALAVFAIFTASCDTEKPELNEPVITVFSPTDNAVVQVNDSLIIKVDFTDDSDLVNYQGKHHQ